MNTSVPPSQVSIVVQGPLLEDEGNLLGRQHSRQMLEGIRRLLPEAEIVLATWKGSRHEGLTYDVLVESEDPGAWRRGCGRTNNVNRQIVSTRDGLRACTRDYAVKLRTDCALSHAGFLSCFESEALRANRLSFFKQRITGCQFFFRDPWKMCLLFHIGDVFHFGLREDLVDLWDLPLVPGDSGPTFIQCLKAGAPRAFRHWARQFSQFEEQHLWTSYLKKKGHGVRLAYPFDRSPSLIVDSELSIANNFAIRSPEQLGLLMPSRLFSTGTPDAVYTNDDWVRLVATYCHPNSDEHVAKRLRRVGRRALIDEVTWTVGQLPRPLSYLNRRAKAAGGGRDRNALSQRLDEEWGG